MSLEGKPWVRSQVRQFPSLSMEKEVKITNCWPSKKNFATKENSFRTFEWACLGLFQAVFIVQKINIVKSSRPKSAKKYIELLTPQRTLYNKVLLIKYKEMFTEQKENYNPNTEKEKLQQIIYFKHYFKTIPLQCPHDESQCLMFYTLLMDLTYTLWH